MAPCDQSTETDGPYPKNGQDIHPKKRVRLLALLLYFGFAPLTWTRRNNTASLYWKSHRKQALILWALLGLITFLLLISVAVLSKLMVYFRNEVDTQRVELWILSLTRKSLLVWGIFWLYGIWRCLRGSTAPVPIIGWLFKCTMFQKTGMIFLNLFFITCFLATSLTIRGERLLTQEASRARTFLLYDDLGFVPRPLFSLAMYRMASTSVRRWGPGSALLRPLTRESLDDAVLKGTFVFVGSHGTAAGLLLDGKYYQPEDVPRPDNNTALRYVYLASCDSGAQRNAWEHALAPATVRTYDRLTPTLEHLWWLWTEGPALLRNLPEPARPTQED